MRLDCTFLLFLADFCLAVRLTPLENNDKLQDITNQYVAEWQWESWPIKQGSSEQDTGKSPGARVNVALWKEGSGPDWYLFGGQSVDTESTKIYSDVWKYSVTTRIWERFFPSQLEVQGANLAKIGGIMTLRANLFDEGHQTSPKSKNYNIVLCGGVAKVNTTKAKKPNIWANFTRRKKQEKEKRELKSLAVYAPKTSKSNTVWQIDLKDKLWTAYVCCCDTGSTTDKKVANSSTGVVTAKTSHPLTNQTKVANVTTTKRSSDKPDKVTKAEANDSAVIDEKINRAEEVADDEEQTSSPAPASRKKKINQTKSETVVKDKNLVEKVSQGSGTNRTEVPASNDTRRGNVTENLPKPSPKLSKKEKYNLKLMSKANKTTTTTGSTSQVQSGKNKTDGPKDSKSVLKPKTASMYCPEFSEDREPVTWCDGNSEVLITADISSPDITLWIFNLKTSHWSQKAVTIPDDVDWVNCSGPSVVRYAGNYEDVYMLCSHGDDVRTEVNTTESRSNSSEPSEGSESPEGPIKSVYRINYKRQVLESLGEIRLNPFFSSPAGRKVWSNETRSVLQIVQTPLNETVLLLAYSDAVDLWILTRSPSGKLYFDSVEKMWRGSALKWFNRYNGALYNFKFVSSESSMNASETILMANPRELGPSEYWPRDRGRFIIRILKNENLKNQSFENRTREQNLTYELLQSDYRAAAPASSSSSSSSSLETQQQQQQSNHSYSFKVLVFFGISLAIFAVFGVVLFLKRCVTCPPRIRTGNECHKSQFVIRYSVIPDDLLYPVA